MPPETEGRTLAEIIRSQSIFSSYDKLAEDSKKEYFESFYEQIGAKIPARKEPSDPNRLYRQVAYWKNREGEEVSLNIISSRYAKNIVAMIDRSAGSIYQRELLLRKKKYGITSVPEYLEVSMSTPAEFVSTLPLYQALKALADSE